MICLASNNLGVWGVIVGVLAIALLFVCSMWMYFLLKKKLASHKWRAEVITIGIVILFSFVIKFLVYFTTLKDNGFVGAMNSVWQALYASIGGLTFEGLSDDENLSVVLKSFYYGSSVYAGLMVLAVFTMKWSYEIFCFFKLLLPETKRDIYVFTALNEETLQLAKSIKSQYKDKYMQVSANKKVRIRKPIIVFSGPKLDAFDRNDDLCRQLVSENFLYWSYYNQTQKKNAYGRSLAQILHLNNKNIRVKEGSLDSDMQIQEARFCIFAYDSKNHIPEEENNTGFVFEDILNRIGRTKKKDCLRIEYYILTKRDIDYQAYDYKNRELMLEFAKNLNKSERENFIREVKKSAKADVLKVLLKHTQSADEKKLAESVDNILNMFLDTAIEGNGVAVGDSFKSFCMSDGQLKSRYKFAFDKLLDEFDIKDNLRQCEEEIEYVLNKVLYNKLVKEFAKHVVVRAVNEALIISKDAINELQLPFEEINDCGITTDERKQLNVYILGFGSTGQAIAKAIHMRSAYIDSNGYATDIHFEVFDSKADNIGGLFAKEHPMWICASGEKANRDFYLNKKQEKISNIYFDGQKENSLTQTFQDIDREIVFPTVKFYAKSCFDLEILDKLDNVTGAEQKNKIFPSIIVVALGSDNDNIKMVNALILDIIREGKSQKDMSPQTIIVNIWDSNNNDLVDSAGGVWNDDHKLLYLDDVKLTVKIVGNNTDIYSYSKMAEHRQCAEYNAKYNKMCEFIDSQYTQEDFANKVSTFLLEKPQYSMSEYEATANLIDDILSYDTSTESSAIADYERLDMWRRESSDCVQEIFEMHSKSLALMPNIIKVDAKGKGEKQVRDEVKVKLFSHLAKVEHGRWLRFHIAGGWVYSKKKRMLVKQHSCIMPFKYLGVNSLYNILNVVQALKEQYGESNIKKQIERTIDCIIEQSKTRHA